MIKFKQTARTGGDETAPYDVILDRQYTVREFIDYVLTRMEWGYIYFKGGPHCEYRGSLLLSAIPDEYMEACIESVKAAGCWVRMDYRIEIKK